MARLDRIDRAYLTYFRQVIVEPLDGVEPTVDGRRGQALPVLCGDEAVHVAPRDLARRLVGGVEEQAQVEAVALDRVRRVVPRRQVQAEPADFFRRHRAPPATACRRSTRTIASSYCRRFVAS
ncbi:MAG: hypothetical protein M3371_11275 [Acidobacteriota bacterium]|nr:hypothetical protein [Acidobacteriota bacterium]